MIKKSINFTISICSLLWNIGALQAQDTPDTSLDTEIFGGSEGDAKPGLSTSQEKSLLDTLQVGGRVELRANTSQQEDKNLNAAGFSHSNQADIFFDSRPNDNIRAFLRYRLAESNTTESNLTLDAASPVECTRCLKSDFDELWIKWDFANFAYFTAGKQHLKWGSAKIWNPTDFTASESRDPLALSDKRLGKSLLKIHIPDEKHSFNYYAVLQFDDVKRNDDIGIALRSEFALGGAGELALSFQTRAGQPLRFGADLSMSLGPLDVYFEGAESTRHNRLFLTGKLDPINREFPQFEKKTQKWFAQAAGGIQKTWKYSETSNLTVGGEYFYNELGYNERTLLLYSLFTGINQPLYTGKSYASAYVRLPNPGTLNNTSFFLTAVRNLSDQTMTTRLTTTWTIFKQATLELFVNRCFGDYGEFCLRVPESFVQLASLPGLPNEQKQLLNSLPRKRIQTTGGLGLTMNF